MSEIYSVRTLPGVAWPGGGGWPAHAADQSVGYLEIDRSGVGDGPFGYVRVTADDSEDRLVLAAQAAADALDIPSGESIFGWAIALQDVLGGAA